MESFVPETDIERNYYMNIREFPDGSFEAVTRPVRPMQAAQAAERFAHPGMVTRLHRSDAEPVEKSQYEKEDNWSRAVRRARQNIRFLCKQMQANRLLTLTYRECMTDRVSVKRHWQEFLRLVRVEYPEFQYVSVLEIQDRGAFHIHCAVRGWYKYSFLRACWYRAIGGTGREEGEETPGSMNMTAPKTRWGSGVTHWKTNKLAGYLTKYLAKTFDMTSSEKKRYWHSRDLSAPAITRVWLASQNIKEMIPEAVGALQLFLNVRPDWDMWLSRDGCTFWLAGQGDGN